MFAFRFRAPRATARRLRQGRLAVLLRADSLESRLAPARLEVASAAAPSMQSAASGGTFIPGYDIEGFAPSRTQFTSDDSRYLVYVSKAANVVVGQVDENNWNDVFL